MITLIFGRREEGKTTLAYFLSRKTPTRVIFAPRPDVLESRQSIPDSQGLFDLLDVRSEIIVKPPVQVIRTFEGVCSELRAWIEENPLEEISFLVDEARFIKTTEYIPESFDWLLRFTPKKFVHTILTAHRPVDIAVDIRAIADFWMIFQTTQEHDLKIIAERCGSPVAEAAKVLQSGQVLIWNDQRGISRQHNDRASWYVSINSNSTEGVSSGS
jgi:AAA+ ATPase superfamily predicted ATPase